MLIRHIATRFAARQVVRRTRTGALAVAFSIAIVHPALAQTIPATRDYDITTGTLAEALNRFAQQSGVALAMDASKVQGLTTTGIKGQYSIEDGFDVLLRDGGFAVSKSPAGYVLVPVSRAGQESGVQHALPAVIVTATAPLPDALPNAYAGDQVARGASLGILGEKDYMDTPFSVSSYTEKTIRDEQAKSVAEVLTTSDSSVRTSIGSSNRYDALTIRGFRVENSDIALNGLYGLVPAYRVGPDPVERIELLKGPGAFLNGMQPSGSIGGAVNIVTKRAGDEPLTRFTTEYLSDSQLGGHFDVARRFGDHEQFDIRMNGALRGGDTAIDNQSTRNQAASVGLDYRDTRVRLSADFIYQNDRMREAARGYTPLTGIALPKAPDPTINLAQSFDYANSRSFTALTRGEVDLTRTVTAFAAVGVNQFDFEKQEAPGATILNQAGDAQSTSTYQEGRSRAVSAEVGVRATIDTGPVTHQLVLSGSRLDQTSWLGQTRYGSYFTNIYSPARLSGPGTPLSMSPVTKSGDSTLQSVAIADTLSVRDGLVQLTLGARRQQVDTNEFATSGANVAHYNESATTPSFALVVRPNEALSFYGSYIEALTAGATPPVDAANPNQVFAPFKSKQYELGAKLDTGRLGATLSFFQISQPGGVVDPSTKIFSLDGEQRNRGIELNGFGEVAKGVRLLGGVTYLDARLQRTQGGVNDGHHAIGAPDVSANIGLEWDTPFVPGLTLTGRTIYTGGAYVSADNTQRVPAYARFDVGARYVMTVAQKPVEWRATVTNVTNRRYWDANPTGYLISGMPRLFWLSATLDF